MREREQTATAAMYALVDVPSRLEASHTMVPSSGLPNAAWIAVAALLRPKVCERERGESEEQEEAQE
jgi:hypothetical protein